MIDTILLDLDGTLLAMAQEVFVKTYFKLLTARLAPMGFEPGAVVDALWQGTAAMVNNDGTVPNARRFWACFGARFNLNDGQADAVRALCDDFYSREFNETRAVLDPVGDAPARAVRLLRDKGYRLALATNPIFPRPAMVSRLGWIGLEPGDFALATDYENIGYCKPNLDYYRELCRRLEADPHRCMMVGNSIAEDMCAGALGMETYLVTGYVEGDGGDLSAWPRRGSIGDFADFAAAMPSLNN